MILLSVINTGLLYQKESEFSCRYVGLWNPGFFLAYRYVSLTLEIHLSIFS